MTRILEYVERNAVSIPTAPVVVQDSVSTTVLPDSRTSIEDEMAYIEIFNAGANKAYYNFGATCDNVQNYNAWLVPGQMLEVKTRMAVNCYSVGGTTISITKISRTNSISSTTQ